MTYIREIANQLNELIEKADNPVEIEIAKNPSQVRAENMVIAAKFAMMLRIPYVFGAEYYNDQAWDCSSFTRALYKSIGSSIPRTTREQIKIGRSVNLSDIRVGDLIFYDVSGGDSVNHVAMYIGNDEMIHTNSPTDGINIQNVHTGKHARWTIDIRRILPW